MLKVLLLAAAIVILAFGGVCLAVCICAGYTGSCGHVDCIIVLGAKVRPDGSLSNTLRKRCNAALAAWRHGIADHIILCGGRGGDEPVPEADAMHAYLLQQGVPETALVRENQSGNTGENIDNAKKIMLSRGWKTAAIVTSDYHIRRALWIAKDLQVPAQGIPCGSPDIPSHWVKSRLQEAVSWILYFVRRI